MNIYPVPGGVCLPAAADLRYGDLSLGEHHKHGCRVIGGDLADLHFDGYDVEGEVTELRNPRLKTSLTLTDDEVIDVAAEVWGAAFDSIGIECVV